jgi:FKBP-type peptidyl-prolyl cis-trans isomerase FkpA
VKAHYKGTFLDGKTFDSSYDRMEPAIFPLDGVIRGWTEGVPLMQVGAKYKFWIPSDLAYGPRGRPSIPPNSTLVFEIELLEVLPGENIVPPPGTP